MTAPLQPQGRRANSSGSTLEGQVVSALAGKGIRHLPFRIWDGVESEVLLQRAPYTSIYGHEAKTEFLLKSARRGVDARIECKWQQVAGSVDEKFPYMYLNAVETMPEPTVIFLVDGEGAKPGAVAWLRRACASGLYLPRDGARKEVVVLNLTGFVRWVNRTFG